MSVPHFSQKSERVCSKCQSDSVLKKGSFVFLAVTLHCQRTPLKPKAWWY